jgi:hypothetical protein
MEKTRQPSYREARPMTTTLYRHRYNGRTYVGMELPNGSAVEMFCCRLAKRELRLIAKEYGITRIKRGLNKPFKQSW